MPRFSTVSPSGCRPVRIITADELGYVKVVESRGQNAGQPQVVSRWGDGVARKGIERMQVISTGPFGGLVAVARSNQTIELLDISSGQPLSSWHQTPFIKAESTTPISRNPIKGLHVLQQPLDEALQVLTCFGGGTASLQKVVTQKGGGVGKASSLAEWDVGAGVESIAVDQTEQSVAVGGKGLDVALWNLETKSRLWQAKNTRPDALGLQMPVWVTRLLFPGGDANKVLAGTGHHQLRLYDVRAQRRPVSVMEFGEMPIWSVAEDPSGQVVYAGNSGGDLASFDLRTGTKSGGFVGAISGSVRSIAVHPTEPLLASVGLDRFLRIHSTKTRQLQAKVFLKQQMVACAFDTGSDRQPEEAAPAVASDEEAEDSDRSMNHVAASGSGSDGSDLEENARSLGGLKQRSIQRKGQRKQKQQGLGSDDEEGESGEDAWDNPDQEGGEGRVKSRVRMGRKKEIERKRKKGFGAEDDENDEEGFSGGDLEGDSDGESDREERPKKKPKGKGRIKRSIGSDSTAGVRSKGSGAGRKKATQKGHARKPRHGS